MNLFGVIGNRIAQAVIAPVVKNMKIEFPERIEGVDAFLSIPEILEQNGVSHPLIVTGPRIAKSEFFSAMIHNLDGEYTIFDKVEPDPKVSQVSEMVELYQKEGCDSFIAIGGGSNMDAAKAAAAGVTRPDKAISELGGLMKVGKPIPLFIAVPTTSGTGSETTVAAVVTDDKTGRKYAINDGVLCPKYAVLDPSLTVSLPPALTAQTGMDAMTHAVEAYLNEKYHTEETKELCEDAVSAIVEFLPRAYEDGSDMEAREEMLIASFKAGEAFTIACVGNVHAIAHTIGGLYHVPHGMANAVILPYVLEDYGEKIYPALARLSEVSGIKTDGSEKEKAKAFIERIKSMNEHMEIPTHFSQINEKDIPTMASWAAKEANPLYPCPKIYSREDFKKMIRKIRG
ncbi:MAG: iron-containing alcohol dehydrogenase [Lachnospiraceae bacterium]|nr:iron-containing alcohol dehydrogenase [Lachnospiraceae bacterium]